MKRGSISSTVLLTLALSLHITHSSAEADSPQPAKAQDDRADKLSPLGSLLLDPHQEQGEFLHQLFDKYGNANSTDGEGRLSFEGLSALMGSIGLGARGGDAWHDHRELGGAVPGQVDNASTHQHSHVEHHGSSQDEQEAGTHDHGAESSSVEPFSFEDQQHSEDREAAVTQALDDVHQDDDLNPTQHTADEEELEHNHLAQCLTPDALLDIFDIPSSASGLTKVQFLQICPVLLQQLDSHVCMQFDVSGREEHHHDSHDDHEDHEDTTTHGHHDLNATGSGAGHHSGHVWGYGIAAVTLISLASITCILVVPCMQHYPHVYHRLLSVLVAMAVGTLAGDAMMHLIPHSLGIHVHDDTKTQEEDGHAHEALEAEKQHARNAVWKGFFVLLGIFMFFIIEQLMASCQQARKDRKARRKTRQRADKKSSSQRPLHSSQREDGSDDQQQEEALQGEYKKINGSEAIGEKLCHHCSPASTSAVGSNREIIRNSMLLLEDFELQNGRVDPASTSHHHHHHHHHDCHDDDPEMGPSHHHGHSHDPPAPGDNSIATLAWIIVMGDGLHNFCDGLIVGAAFADSVAGGLSTSIAVMCHEIPHELGDFAVMLKGGMSIKQALCVQAISSVLAYMGLAIGIAAGNVEAVSMWIFALAGGMFVYIALVDLFPELIETLNGNPGKKVQLLGLQAMGTVLGVGIMLLIGLQEDWLREQLDG
ncbi:zinc transporter ZIP10-like [Patiria miniata]|uniref:Uncharacterized protein n=1 Tax=Patiria miniata TaxID=46514 RepID=A0A914BSD6_PATMI|nr:zinc transporter ZIP10-like [Patiria miniata]